MRSALRVRQIVAIICCAAVGLVSGAMAQDPPGQQDMAARLAQLEAEMAGLRQQPPGGFVEEGPVVVAGPAANPCGFYAGGQAVWSGIFVKNNPSIVLNSTDFATFATTTTTEFDYDYEITPRVYAGYTCAGTGIRGGWWELEDDSADSLVVPDLPGIFSQANGRLVAAFDNETISVSQEFKLELAELEFTQGLEFGNTAVLVSYGVRYVYYSDYIRERVTDAGGTLMERAWVYDWFEGVGPTLAVEWWRPCLGTGFVVHGSLRGTVAFGEQNQTSRFTDPINGFQADTARSGDVAQAIGEIDLGLSWTNGGWVVGAGWRAQYWDDANEGDGIFFGGTVTPGLSDVGVNQFYLEVAYHQ